MNYPSLQPPDPAPILGEHIAAIHRLVGQGQISDMIHDLRIIKEKHFDFGLGEASGYEPLGNAIRHYVEDLLPALEKLDQQTEPEFSIIDDFVRFMEGHQE